MTWRRGEGVLLVVIIRKQVFFLRIGLEVQPILLEHACYQVFEGAYQEWLPVRAIHVG